ncbi:Uncharacterised protein [Serratia liquefaciens]|nr:Uncharacterised protein [Serratia liquefaciens]
MPAVYGRPASGDVRAGLRRPPRAGCEAHRYPLRAAAAVRDFAPESTRVPDDGLTDARKIMRTATAGRLCFSLTYLFSTEQWRGHTMSGAMQAFFRASQRTARVCQRWLTKDEKRPDAEARPECYAFGGSGFPLCSLPFGGCLPLCGGCLPSCCGCLPSRCGCFAVVLRLLTIVLAVFHRRFTLMLRAFFPAAAAGCRQQKPMTTFPASLRRTVKLTSS